MVGVLSGENYGGGFFGNMEAFCQRSPSCIVSCKKEAFAPPSHSPSLTSKSSVRL